MCPKSRKCAKKKYIYIKVIHDTVVVYYFYSNTQECRVLLLYALFNFCITFTRFVQQCRVLLLYAL